MTPPITPPTFLESFEVEPSGTHCPCGAPLHAAALGEDGAWCWDCTELAGEAADAGDMPDGL